MNEFICLIAGIHDIPNSPRSGERVIANCKTSALEHAASRYGLNAVPPGSSATPLPKPHPSLAALDAGSGMGLAGSFAGIFGIKESSHD